MPENELPPMAPGGQWLRSSGDREPHYVVHEAHIKRLQQEGWQPAEDPRKPQKPTEKPVDAEKAEMQARIAKLEAMLQQVLAPKSENVSEEPDASQINDEQSDSKDATNDRRPKRK